MPPLIPTDNMAHDDFTQSVLRSYRALYNEIPDQFVTDYRQLQVGETYFLYEFVWTNNGKIMANVHPKLIRITRVPTLYQTVEAFNDKIKPYRFIQHLDAGPSGMKNRVEFDVLGVDFINTQNGLVKVSQDSTRSAVISQYRMDVYIHVPDLNKFSFGKTITQSAKAIRNKRERYRSDVKSVVDNIASQVNRSVIGHLQDFTGPYESNRLERPNRRSLVAKKGGRKRRSKRRD